jgi:hypothetical protein
MWWCDHMIVSWCDDEMVWYSDSYECVMMWW